ncbi:hypothetical protein KVK70_07315 [Helicobacter pylori]|nr:hypothetical protein KVK70_07315 [Helicobacter pylori]
MGKNKEYGLKVGGILNAWAKKFLALFDIRITNPLAVSIRSLQTSYKIKKILKNKLLKILL